jgi:hypothetical protein
MKASVNLAKGRYRTMKRSSLVILILAAAADQVDWPFIGDAYELGVSGVLRKRIDFKIGRAHV